MEDNSALNWVDFNSELSSLQQNYNDFITTSPKQEWNDGEKQA